MDRQPSPEFASMPPLIVALDTENAGDAIKHLDSLSKTEFGQAGQIGFKIARWHDQHLDLRRACYESGLFTVLDTQLDDGIDEMTLAAKSLLAVTDSAGKLLLPQAITMSRAKETVRSQRELVRDKIFRAAHEQAAPVMVISHIDQTRMLPSDPNLQETDSVDSFSSTRVGFDAIELHADTVLSHHFEKERQRAEAEGLEVPLFLASRFSFGFQDSDETAVINRAANTYRRGVQSIYLGRSIMNSLEPRAIVEQILTGYEDSRYLQANEDFAAKYPLRDPSGSEQLLTNNLRD